MVSPSPSLWQWGAWIAGLLCLLPACAGISYEYRSVEKPPAERAMAMLTVGATDLQTCLDTLGAPMMVRKDEQGDGLEILWQWEEHSAWGFFVSIPTGTDYSPSLNWANREQQPQFLRLFFSGDGTLQRLSRG